MEVYNYMNEKRYISYIKPTHFRVTVERLDEIFCIAEENNILGEFLINASMCIIPVNELKAKIEYLKEHFMPIVLEDGKFNPIFKMSNKVMLQTYGIDKKTLIANYTNQRRK